MVGAAVVVVVVGATVVVVVVGSAVVVVVVGSAVVVVVVVVVVGKELQPWEKDGLGSSPKNGSGAKMEGRCSSSSIFSSYPTY